MVTTASSPNARRRQRRLWRVDSEARVINSLARSSRSDMEIFGSASGLQERAGGQAIEVNSTNFLTGDHADRRVAFGGSLVPPSRVQKILNLYGDLPKTPVDDFGHDISSQRFDDLDYACLSFIISQREAAPRGIDLGSGMGTPSVAFALAGAQMTLIDRQDLSERFDRLSQLLPTTNLRFERGDLVKIRLDVIPISMDFIYSQRTLHYLPFAALLALLSTLVERMRVGGRAFISVSGLDSELGDGYLARNEPLETRFAHLDDSMSAKHHIAAKVCLYNCEELTGLALAAGLAVVDIAKSPFGNIKGVFEKPKPQA